MPRRPHPPCNADWAAIEPLEYLSPFLEVVRSPETSGPITLCALTSLLRLLRRGVLGAAALGVVEAVQAAADAVTQCKFEATYPASDECVLAKILEVRRQQAAEAARCLGLGAIAVGGRARLTV